MYTTKVEIAKSRWRITPRQRGLVLGSCFAENIGGQLRESFFDVVVNPCGILFNPVSIGNSYCNIVERRKFREDELVFANGLWHSMEHHGTFSAADPAVVLGRINGEVPTHYDYVSLTLGTSWIYERQGEVVANCHKMHADEFTRRRISVEEAVASLERVAMSGAQVIVTVSPVRHLRDGLAENSLSKSILRLAAAHLCERFENVIYFPSYEIVNDELRDYRYYADDMLHPSAVAIKYIWQRFSETFFDSSTLDFVHQVSRLRRTLAHRQLNNDSLEYEILRLKTEAQLDELVKNFMKK